MNNDYRPYKYGKDFIIHSGIEWQSCSMFVLELRHTQLLVGGAIMRVVLGKMPNL
jgi:hypothetical protein